MLSSAAKGPGFFGKRLPEPGAEFNQATATAMLSSMFPAPRQPLKVSNKSVLTFPPTASQTITF